MPKEDSRKRRTEKTLTRLRAQAKEEDQERIARLEAALEQSEEQLQDSTDLDNDLDPMDGVETDASDQAVDGGQSSSSNSGSADATPAQAQGGNSNPQQVEANVNPASTVKTEPDDGNDDDDDGDDGDDDTPLFVPETEPDPASEPEDPEYGAPLFTRPGPQLGNNVTTVGWTSGRKTQYINMYGKKSAARYRIEDAADTAEYEDSLQTEDKKQQCVTLRKNRFGDRKLDNDKWEFTKRHMRSIYGVAWEGAGTGDSAADLKLIEPYEGRPRWPGTYVLVAWVTGTYLDTSGASKEKIEKAWETRATLRARWGTKSADENIYKAACEAEMRYEEAVTGKRRAVSRTPSVGLIDADLRRFREQSLAADQASSSGNRQSLVPETSRSGTPGVRASSVQSLAGLLEEFKLGYCECAGVASFKDLDAAGKADFVQAWQLAKAKAIGAS
ncbi:hypothetical protein G6514_004065 [Epicoccum nigrum]|nr:hypothetical protein G6514_004065 [Epicoccum nigrum]